MFSCKNIMTSSPTNKKRIFEDLNLTQENNASKIT